MKCKLNLLYSDIMCFYVFFIYNCVNMALNLFYLYLKVIYICILFY